MAKPLKVKHLTLGLTQTVTVKRHIAKLELVDADDVVVVTWSDGKLERFTEVSSNDPAIEVD